MLRKTILLISLVLVVGFTFGCEKKGIPQTEINELPAKLVYYTIGNADTDLAPVNDALNEMLLKKMNATIEYKKIPWADYGERLSAMINSGVDFDIAFASSITQGDFVGNAQKGAWLELSPYLNGSASKLYDTIDPLYWKGIQVNRKIYGVPTNKEIAVPLMFMYPQSIVEKYDIDISKYKTIASLAPLLKTIKENEPEYVGLQLAGAAHNYFAIDGYEFVLSQDVPLMVKSKDENPQVVNIYETQHAKEVLHSLRQYYELGYINQDAALIDSHGLIPGEKVFVAIAEGGPYSDVLWSNDRQYKVLAEQVSDAVVTSESTQGGVMVVNAKSKNPDKSVEFLNLLNTDPEVRNLINFGIEGVHYTLTKEQQVQRISSDYAGVQYTQGNWFILKTVVGEPLNKWDEFTTFNNKAVKSGILGFNASTSRYNKEIEAIRAVWRKYYPFLMTGSVDDDYFLPRFNAELKAAGIDHLARVMQTQLDVWKRISK